MNYLFALSTLLTIGLLQGTAHANEWRYEGAQGPAHWAKLDAANLTCALGKTQSPINITPGASRAEKLPTLDFSYHSNNAEVVNTGHTVQVNLPAGNRLNIGDYSAELLQLHFHTPSEERFNGESYPMDAHLVHKAADGTLAVVAVLFKEGKANPMLEKVLSGIPQAGQLKALEQFDPAQLLPKNHSYYRFTGSLTTPPCSENVRWQVLREVVEVSKAQIDAFRARYPMNARPVQPLNGRVIERSE